MKFDLERGSAASIEHSFVRLDEGRIGARGTPWDAGVWTQGSPRRIGDALVKAADTLDYRISQMKLGPNANESGMPVARLTVAVQRLRHIGEELKKTDAVEPNDYHWDIVGLLVSMIDALLEHVGA